MKEDLLPDRFWSKVDKTDTCWLWLGGTSRGYGQFFLGSGMRSVHRISYETLVKKVPSGLQLDHLCRVRHCVNPDHLEIVTNRINSLRGVSFAAKNYKKTNCPQGHEYTSDNTYYHGDGKRWRMCATCQKIRSAEYKRRKKCTL